MPPTPSGPCGRAPGRAGAASACFAVTCVGAAERHRLNARYNSRYAEAAFTALGGAPYRSRMLGFDTGDVRVLDMHETGGLGGRAAVRDDAFSAWFALGLGGDRGHWADAGPHLVVAGPGTEFPVDQDGEVRSLRVSVRGDVLRRLAADATARLGGGLRRPRVSAAREWRLQRAILRSTRFAEQAAARGIDVGGALQIAADGVVAEMLDVLEDAEARTGRAAPGPAARRRLVARAVELLETHDGEPASLADVCRRLQVGQRTLQRAFQETLGTGLRAYERERRLRGVHAAILTAGDRRSVTDIAMHFGFWHLGRFAGAYAAMFGCAPSETRRQVWGGRPSPSASGSADPAAQAAAISNARRATLRAGSTGTR